MSIHRPFRRSLSRPVKSGRLMDTHSSFSSSHIIENATSCYAAVTKTKRRFQFFIYSSVEKRKILLTHDQHDARRTYVSPSQTVLGAASRINNYSERIQLCRPFHWGFPDPHPLSNTKSTLKKKKKKSLGFPFFLP